MDVFEKSGKKPFKPNFLHTLEAGDTEARMEFCLWLQGMYLQNPDFLQIIIYTDEATYTTNGIVSSQNIRMWSESNPHWVVECERLLLEALTTRPEVASSSRPEAPNRGDRGGSTISL
ncbi:hypothetical protein NQ318_010113 [Aromia moschata]|uniref:Uncharacterized protein n=1 Tax=Aromia moschata TaxID=1265417 RepID=A0AAV8Y817_9CUCU|nr:hypothetical protein NQ318_010113 [Aromia moschata]